MFAWWGQRSTALTGPTATTSKLVHRDQGIRKDGEMKWPELIRAMDATAVQAMAQLEQANVFDLNLSRGECREAVIGSAIRPWLPRRYGLRAGEVVGADGSRSKALDIVVYDALYSVVFEAAGGKVLCPAESVFGSIEVKTMLDGRELDDGISKGQSLAAIARERTDAYQFTPTAGLALGRGLTGDERPRHHYVTGIVAVDAMEGGRILQELEDRQVRGEEHLPDLVVCLSKQWIIAKANRGRAGNWTLGDTEWGYDAYAWAELGDRTITVMNLLLQAKLQNINLPKSQAEDILTEALRPARTRFTLRALTGMRELK